MASATTASQTELKEHGVPLGWRDGCSAYASLFPHRKTITDMVLSRSFLSSRLCLIPLRLENINHYFFSSFGAASYYHSTSVGSKITTFLGNVTMSGIHTKSMLNFPVFPTYISAHSSIMYRCQYDECVLYILISRVFSEWLILPFQLCSPDEGAFKTEAGCSRGSRVDC